MTGPAEEPGYVHRVTKYDPADRDERGYYVGTESSECDHGPVEAAYLAAVRAFAEEAGVERLTVRDPELSGAVHFGLGAAQPDDGLGGLFPDGPTGFFDGAEVPLAAALELVRVMLRESGAWCRLEAGAEFFVHVGYDQYVYLGSARPLPSAVERTAGLGLFAERIAESPYRPEPVEAGVRPADREFWQEAARLAEGEGGLLVEEQYAGNTSRWHRLAGAAEVEPLRRGLVPRSLIRLWPDLSADVAAVLAGLPPEGSNRLVWQEDGAPLRALWVYEEDHPALPGLLAGACAAALLTYGSDDPDGPDGPDRSGPLLAAVLPDADGVVRARRTL